MTITRRDFLRTSALLAGAIGLATGGLPERRAYAALDGVPVIWLQGQGCSGCSVSVLNSIYYDTIDSLLLNTLDMKYNSTVMAAAGETASTAAEAAFAQGGYVLVVEGAVPTGANGAYAWAWPGMTVLQAVQRYAQNAAYIIAVGTCACYGGIPGANPNPTGAQSVSDVLPGKTVLDIPGCPIHPDWLIGSIAYILANGRLPELENGRPKAYFSRDVHEQCPRKDLLKASGLAQEGCLRHLGCKGPETKADCPNRRWNSPGKSTPGVNWCIGANSPCHGCTEPGFPDEFSPFFQLEGGG